MTIDAPLIEARALTRHYGRNTAVHQLGLQLHRGEILGLLGPNGAGKSTTMKMLTGNLAPSEGEVLIQGVSLREDARRAKQALGYLPEQPPVYPELTVDEYLGYCASLHGIARTARAAAVTTAKADCGLTAVGQRLIGNLSKGYQQRVGLAQAIIHRPPVIVLDEPTVGLDPIQIREIRSLIATLARNHSVILSSHILPEIQAVCSRVMIVNRGRCVYDAAIDAHLRRSLRLELAEAVAEARIAAVPGVAAVETLEAGRYRVTPAEGADPRAALGRALADAGLLELRQDSRSLEDIFVELTAGDAAPIKEAA